MRVTPFDAIAIEEIGRFNAHATTTSGRRNHPEGRGGRRAVAFGDCDIGCISPRTPGRSQPPIGPAPGSTSRGPAVWRRTIAAAILNRHPIDPNGARCQDPPRGVATAGPHERASHTTFGRPCSGRDPGVRGHASGARVAHPFVGKRHDRGAQSLWARRPRGLVQRRRRSANTGIVRMPAVLSAYSAKPG